MLQMFLQSEPPPSWVVAIIAAGGVVFAAAVGGLITFFAMRKKTGAEAFKIVTETSALLAAELRKAQTDLGDARGTIESQAVTIHKLGRLSEKGEESEEKLKKAAAMISKIQSAFAKLRLAHCPAEVVDIINEKREAAEQGLIELKELLDVAE